MPNRDRAADTDGLADRVDGLVAWIQELDTRVRATEAATGDEKTAKELRKAVEAAAKHDPKFEERIQNKVDVLADRVATLAGAVSTTTAALAGKDGEIATLRRELALATGVLAELQTEARRVAHPPELDELRRAVERIAAERSSKGESKKVDALAEKLALLDQRIDTVSGTVSTAAAGVAGAEGEVAALRRRMDEEGARLEAMVSELRAAVDPVPLHELRAGLDGVSAQVATVQQETRRDLVAAAVDLETLTHRIAGAEATLASTVQAAAGTGSDVAQVRARVEAGDARGVALGEAIAALDERVRELADRVDDAGTALREETDSLRTRMEAGDERVGVLDLALSGLGAQLTGLGERVDVLADTARAAELEAGAELASLATRFDAGCAQVDALVEDLRTAIDTMPALVPGLDATLLERVAAVVERLAVVEGDLARVAESDESARIVERVEALVGRVAVVEGDLALAAADESATRLGDRMEQLLGRVAAVEEQVTRAAENDESASARLFERVESLVGRVAAVEERVVRATESDESARLRDRVDAVAGRMAAVEDAVTRAAENDEVATVRGLAEDLARRLAAAESEVASLAHTRGAIERADELAQRLAAVEASLRAASALPPVAGAGRFRVELRALELRLEHAEVAAREERNAVFTQIERLAKEIENRLQPLESTERGDLYDDADAQGRVVPIRSSEA